MNAKKISRIVFLLFLGSNFSMAQQPGNNQHFQKAKIFIEELHYADAVPELKLALSVGGQNKAQVCEIYYLLGIVHIVLGNDDSAKHAIVQLLNLCPDYKLKGDLSPKIKNYFEETKKNFRPQVSISISGKPGFSYLKKDQVKMFIPLLDVQNKVSSVEINYRVGDDGKFDKLIMSSVGNSKGSYYAVLNVRPADLSPRGVNIEYFLVPRGKTGLPLLSLGTQEHPKSAKLLPPPPGLFSEENQGELVSENSPSWYKSWWFWTGVGVVVAGTAIGLGVGLKDDSHLPESTLGEWTLNSSN